MSGVEVAGLVLGAFPLLIEALKSYPKLARSVRQWNQFLMTIDEYTDTLSTQRIIYWDRVAQLIDDIVPADELSKLYDGAGPNVVQDLEAGSHILKIRLGTEKYRLFLNHSERIATALYSIEKLLCVDKKTKIPWDKAGFIRREKGKFRLAVNKDEIHLLFERIRQANEDLEGLTRRNIFSSSDDGPNIRKNRPLYTEDIVGIRFQAQSLLKAIMEPPRWNCECRPYHTAMIKLSGPHGRGVRPRLELLFSQRAGSARDHTCSPSGWICVEADLKNAKADPVTAPVSPKSRTPNPPKPAKVSFHHTIAKKIRFGKVKFTAQSPPAQPSGNTVPAAIAGVPASLTQIRSLCEVLRSLEAYQADQCIGFIPDGRGLAHHMLYAAPQSKVQRELVPFRAFLDSCSQREFLWDQALELALTLALNVIRMSGSWMRASWDSSDILVASHGKQEVNIDQACLEWDVTSNHAPPSNSPNPTTSLASHLVRSEATFSLGIMLVELALNRPISELLAAGDRDGDARLQNLKTATRLLPKIRGNKGKTYSKALEACLFIPSSVTSTSFDDKEFQDYFLRSIVSPLMADFQVMFATSVS
ncbi:MAG: hypothetical protein Q9160_005782 [Pyrenula sp. 1 TL-2023]